MSGKATSFRAIWWNGSTAFAAVLFILSFALLPLWSPIYLIHDHIVEPLTDLIFTEYGLGVALKDHDIEIWLLSGLLINFLSIVFAAGSVIRRGSGNRFDLIMQGLAWVAAVVTLLSALSVRFIATDVVWVSLVFYGVYCLSDLAGMHRYWSDAKSKSAYLFPFLCLDLPALGTTLIILIAATDDRFAHGMAAGHLVFGAIAYFGMMAILLPWAVAVLCREQPVARDGGESGD